MKYLLIFTLLFLSGCTWFAKKEIQSATELSKLTPTQQSTVYITKTLSQTNWLVTICLLGVGLGFFAFLSGNGMGLKIMASCAVVICGSLILASAVAWIAVATKWIIILAVIAAALGLAALAYAIFVKGKALKEIVAGVQKLKDNVLIAGQETKTMEILSDQSPSTKSIVASIKESLPAGG
ncbi:MAG: hypothetical protein IMZ61_03235 [Planctomycetes bacterium]|nr:hypothetical protein [Planctomycetota bacterium]